jgi:hypothetical protein
MPYKVIDNSGYPDGPLAYPLTPQLHALRLCVRLTIWAPKHDTVIRPLQRMNAWIKVQGSPLSTD